MSFKLSPRFGVEELKAIMKYLPEHKALVFHNHLHEAMLAAAINTIPRQAAFLSQLAHESGDLRYWEELADGTAYDGRKDLGNVQPGDGPRYKGRGPIQLTGRKNYRAAGLALSVDLEGSPELAADPSVGFRVATWYWTTRDLNTLADVFDIDGITKSINGGYNGRAHRNECYLKALKVLATASL